MMDIVALVVIGYFVGAFLFFIGVCVYVQYQYKYGRDRYRMISERFDVVMGCTLGFLASFFWPGLAVVMLGVWLAKRILAYMVLKGQQKGGAA